jgi:S-adenosylmethionine uptake transporter
MNDVLFKMLGQRIPATEITFLRFLFGTLSLGLMIKIFNIPLKTKHLGVHFLRGTLLFGGMTVWGLGLNVVPLTDAIVINFTIPIFTLILARLVLKERFDIQRWLATFLGFIGVLIVTRPTEADFNPQCLILLASAALFSCCDILNKFYVTKESMIAMLFYTALFTAIIGAIPAGLEWITPSLKELILTMLLGLGANVILFFILKAFEHVDASATAPLRYVELILSACSGYIIFGEIPKLSTWVGAFLIIPATIGLVLHEASKNQANEQ